MTIQISELRRLLRYDADTGHLWWLTHEGRKQAGKPAGTDIGNGYIAVRIAGTRYKAHRLAWALQHGDWPDGMIDHRNGIRHDNRIANLRTVSRTVNAQNQRRPMCDNKSGFLGVSPFRGKWKATIVVAGKTTFLGHFDSPERAHQEYLQAKRNMHEGCTI